MENKFERTIAEYEEELGRSTEEKERQRRLLDAVFSPQLRLHRADVQQLSVIKEEVPHEQQEWSSSLDQERPEPPHIKEEQEDLWTSQEGGQLQGLEEAETTFIFTPVPVKSEDEDEEKPQSSQLHHRLNEQLETEAEGKDCGGPEAARNSDPDTYPEPESVSETGDSSEPETDVQQLSVIKEEVPPEQQEWSSSLDQERPEPQHIKEEQEDLWTSQEGGQLQRLEEAETTFIFTPVPVKSEDEDEEKPQSSQLHRRLNEQLETEAEGKDCGGPEAARNSDPDTYPEPESVSETGDSSEPETDKAFSCSECRKGFTTKGSLKRHMSSHTGEKPFVCSVCSKAFRDRSDLKRHMRIHKGEKPFVCSVCGKAFSESGNLKLHMRSHTGEKPYSCSVCSKAFPVRGDLKKHMRIHTGEKPFSCSVCSKAFSVRGHLQLHMRAHTGEKPYSCSVCSKAFGDRGDLKKHMRIHTGEKPYSCTVCSQAFSERRKFNLHMRSHTGEKPYNCSVCSKYFSDREHLKTHMRVHTGEKPFSCSVCRKAFSQSGHLKTHMIIHTGEKPFSCSVCSKAFSKSGDLKRHIRSHSERNLSETPASSSTDQIETEAVGEDYGGPEAARNSDPVTHPEPDTVAMTGDSSDPETDDSDDWK